MAIFGYWWTGPLFWQSAELTTSREHEYSLFDLVLSIIFKHRHRIILIIDLALVLSGALMLQLDAIGGCSFYLPWNCFESATTDPNAPVMVWVFVGHADCGVDKSFLLTWHTWLQLCHCPCFCCSIALRYFHPSRPHLFSRRLLQTHSADTTFLHIYQPASFRTCPRGFKFRAWLRVDFRFVRYVQSLLGPCSEYDWGMIRICLGYVLWNYCGMFWACFRACLRQESESIKFLFRRWNFGLFRLWLGHDKRSFGVCIVCLGYDSGTFRICLEQVWFAWVYLGLVWFFVWGFFWVRLGVFVVWWYV